MTGQDAPSRIWTLRRDDQEVACQARLVPYGIEVDIVRGGKVALTRVFENDTQALEWASVKRTAREAEGWVPAPAPPETPSRPVA